MQPTTAPFDPAETTSSPQTPRSSSSRLFKVREREAERADGMAHRPSRHIVHLIKHCGYANGNVHVAVDLACVQARAGHQVTFISAGGTFVPLLEQYGVQHITLNHDQNNPFRSCGPWGRSHGSPIAKSRMSSTRT